MHLEPAADVPAEQAADCTCYSVEECTGKSDERLFLDQFLKSIYLVPEFTEWTDWSECSVTCGDGERTRSRTCIAGCSNIDENDSNHSLVQAEVCSQAACGKFPYHMAQRRSRLDHSVSKALTGQQPLKPLITYTSYFIKYIVFASHLARTQISVLVQMVQGQIIGMVMPWTFFTMETLSILFNHFLMMTRNVCLLTRLIRQMTYLSSDQLAMTA